MGRLLLWETWTGSVSPLLCGFPDRGARRGEFGSRARRARGNRGQGSGNRGQGTGANAAMPLVARGSPLKLH